MLLVFCNKAGPNSNISPRDRFLGRKNLKKYTTRLRSIRSLYISVLLLGSGIEIGRCVLLWHLLPICSFGPTLSRFTSVLADWNASGYFMVACRQSPRTISSTPL
eukprot:Lithocolla_globosa_v1_NODE_1393_length_2612_cov_3.151349.p5 type:complete len:105 gc:universal NODE_1393_length_2612_cov_3.151349:677-991(+)